MKLEKKWRVLGFVVPVIILFIMWNVYTNFDDGALRFSLASGELARYYNHDILRNNFDLSIDERKVVSSLTYFALNILFFIYRIEIGTILKKLFQKI